MPEARRLHPSAVVIYSADALRSAAFPLVAIVGVTLLGGQTDTRGLLRALVYGAIGLAVSVLVGVMRYQTTTYRIDAEAIHHHTGILSTKDTDIRLDRIEAIDVHQGPLQRLFGVFAVDIQTGAAAKGGEIALPALTPEAVAELRAARPQAASSATAEDAPAGPSRRISGRDLAIAALTAGQLGIVLPVLAGAGQILQQTFNEQRGEEAIRWLPHTAHRDRRRRRRRCWCSPGCSRRSARSSPSAASPSPATATGCGSAAGSSSGARRPSPSPACAPCASSRASSAARSGSPR